MSYTEKDCVDKIRAIVRAKAGVIRAGIIFDDESLADILSSKQFKDFHLGQKLMLEGLREALIVETEYLEALEKNEKG